MRTHTLQVLDEYKLKLHKLQRKVDIWEKKHVMINIIFIIFPNCCQVFQTEITHSGMGNIHTHWDWYTPMIIQTKGQ